MRWNLDLGQCQVEMPEGMTPEEFMEGLSAAIDSYCQANGCTMIEEPEDSELEVDVEAIAELVN